MLRMLNQYISYKWLWSDSVMEADIENKLMRLEEENKILKSKILIYNKGLLELKEIVRDYIMSLK